MIYISSIVTLDHVDKALTMFGSMCEHQECFLHLLIVDNHQQTLNLKNVQLYKLDDLINHQTFGKDVRAAVARHNHAPPDRPTIIAPKDYVRWALKPIFANILLEQHESIVYCDSDLFFYNDYKFLIDDAADCSMLVSPHWRNIYHSTTHEWRFNFEHGLYNGGFFLVTRKGKRILNWWTEMCNHECTASSPTTYVDQRYLDVVPLYFPDVQTIMHKGCNVAAWNHQYLPRTAQNGTVLVADNPIIFIHYSPITIATIKSGIDHYLTNHLRQYYEALAETRAFLLRGQHQTMISDNNKIVI